MYFFSFQYLKTKKFTFLFKSSVNKAKRIYKKKRKKVELTLRDGSFKSRAF